VNPGAQAWESVTSSADGAKLAAVVAGGSIWTSPDSGQMWTETSAGNGRISNWYGIASSSDGMKLAAVACCRA